MQEITYKTGFDQALYASVEGALDWRTTDWEFNESTRYPLAGHYSDDNYYPDENVTVIKQRRDKRLIDVRKLKATKEDLDRKRRLGK
jgi:hypothetical protein